MEKLYEIIRRKNKKQMVDIFEQALDLMQQYNGRSKFYCVATALGYDVIIKDNGKELAVFNPKNEN